jgi:hypothetical protein
LTGRCGLVGERAASIGFPSTPADCYHVERPGARLQREFTVVELPRWVVIGVDRKFTRTPMQFRGLIRRDRGPPRLPGPSVGRTGRDITDGRCTSPHGRTCPRHFSPRLRAGRSPGFGDG